MGKAPEQTAGEKRGSTLLQRSDQHLLLKRSWSQPWMGDQNQAGSEACLYFLWLGISPRQQLRLPVRAPLIQTVSVSDDNARGMHGQIHASPQRLLRWSWLSCSALTPQHWSSCLGFQRTALQLSSAGVSWALWGDLCHPHPASSGQTSQEGVSHMLSNAEK